MDVSLCFRENGPDEVMGATGAMARSEKPARLKSLDLAPVFLLLEERATEARIVKDANTLPPIYSASPTALAACNGAAGSVDAGH
jgi:hypothetical protein